MEGICPQCGRHYYGWVLRAPGSQTCEQCGSRLMLFRDGVPFVQDDAYAAAPPRAAVLTAEPGRHYPDLLNLWLPDGSQAG